MAVNLYFLDNYHIYNAGTERFGSRRRTSYLHSGDVWLESGLDRYQLPWLLILWLFSVSQRNPGTEPQFRQTSPLNFLKIQLSALCDLGNSPPTDDFYHSTLFKQSNSPLTDDFYHSTLFKQSNSPLTDDLTIQRSAIWAIQIGFQ